MGQVVTLQPYSGELLPFLLIFRGMAENLSKTLGAASGVEKTRLWGRWTQLTRPRLGPLFVTLANAPSSYPTCLRDHQVQKSGAPHGPSSVHPNGSPGQSRQWGPGSQLLSDDATRAGQPE